MTQQLSTTNKLNRIQKILHAIALVPLFIVMGAAAGATFGLLPGGAFLAITSNLADVSLWIFTLLLACTPLSIVTGWRWPLKLRRPLGLYTFLYALMHYFVFSSAFGFAVGATAVATISSFMLVFGFVALALMIPLALTSNRFSMRTLGGNWKRLHYLTYVVAIFIIFHLFALGRGGILAALYLVLLGIRIPSVRRKTIQLRRSLFSGKRSVQAATSAS